MKFGPGGWNGPNNVSFFSVGSSLPKRAVTLPAEGLLKEQALLSLVFPSHSSAFVYTLGPSRSVHVDAPRVHQVEPVWRNAKLKIELLSLLFPLPVCVSAGVWPSERNRFNYKPVGNKRRQFCFIFLPHLVLSTRSALIKLFKGCLLLFPIHPNLPEHKWMDGYPIILYNWNGLWGRRNTTSLTQGDEKWITWTSEVIYLRTVRISGRRAASLCWNESVKQVLAPDWEAFGRTGSSPRTHRRRWSLRRRMFGLVS